jgi:hypothetical protein
MMNRGPKGGEVDGRRVPVCLMHRTIGKNDGGEPR